MRALVRELWPDEFDAKPKLTIVKEPAPVKEAAPTPTRLHGRAWWEDYNKRKAAAAG
jgi:hypothetical protein